MLYISVCFILETKGLFTLALARLPRWDFCSYVAFQPAFWDETFKKLVTQPKFNGEKFSIFFVQAALNLIWLYVKCQMKLFRASFSKKGSKVSIVCRRSITKRHCIIFLPVTGLKCSYGKISTPLTGWKNRDLSNRVSVPLSHMNTSKLLQTIYRSVEARSRKPGSKKWKFRVLFWLTCYLEAREAYEGIYHDVLNSRISCDVTKF